MRPSKARSELSVGLVCHLRWVTYDAPCTCGLVVKHPERCGDRIPIAAAPIRLVDRYPVAVSLTILRRG
jgi:hypothetical protein